MVRIVSLCMYTFDHNMGTVVCIVPVYQLPLTTHQQCCFNGVCYSIVSMCNYLTNHLDFWRANSLKKKKLFLRNMFF